MKSRRRLRVELDRMTERWLRQVGRNTELRGENAGLLAELGRVAAGLQTCHAAKEAAEGELAVALLRVEQSHRNCDVVTFIDASDPNPLATPPSAA